MLSVVRAHAESRHKPYSNCLLEDVLKLASALTYDVAGTSDLEVVDSGRDSGDERLEETRAEQIVVRQRNRQIIVKDIIVVVGGVSTLQDKRRYR